MREIYVCSLPSYLWIGIVVSLVVWTIWKFFIWRDIPERILEQEELMKKEKLQEELKKREVKQLYSAGIAMRVCVCVCVCVTCG